MQSFSRPLRIWVSLTLFLAAFVAILADRGPLTFLLLLAVGLPSMLALGEALV